jgi:hypothetical protein
MKNRQREEENRYIEEGLSRSVNKAINIEKFKEIKKKRGLIFYLSPSPNREKKPTGKE